MSGNPADSQCLWKTVRFIVYFHSKTTAKVAADFLYLAARSESQSSVPGVMTSCPQPVPCFCISSPLKIWTAITLSDVLWRDTHQNDVCCDTASYYMTFIHVCLIWSAMSCYVYIVCGNNVDRSIDGLNVMAHSSFHCICFRWFQLASKTRG